MVFQATLTIVKFHDCSVKRIIYLLLYDFVCTTIWRGWVEIGSQLSYLILYFMSWHTLVKSTFKVDLSSVRDQSVECSDDWEAAQAVCLLYVVHNRRQGWKHLKGHCLPWGGFRANNCTENEDGVSSCLVPVSFICANYQVQGDGENPQKSPLNKTSFCLNGCDRGARQKTKSCYEYDEPTNGFK